MATPSRPRPHGHAKSCREIQKRFKSALLKIIIIRWKLLINGASSDQCKCERVIAGVNVMTGNLAVGNGDTDRGGVFDGVIQLAQRR
ncbi:uncharacterized [Tachysurus ichikawai]